MTTVIDNSSLICRQPPELANSTAEVPALSQSACDPVSVKLEGIVEEENPVDESMLLQIDDSRRLSARTDLTSSEQRLSLKMESAQAMGLSTRTDITVEVERAPVAIDE